MRKRVRIFGVILPAFIMLAGAAAILFAGSGHKVPPQSVGPTAPPEAKGGSIFRDQGLRLTWRCTTARVRFVKAREIIRMIEAEGWYLDRTRRSHRQ
jgi:hypothetical protein